MTADGGRTALVTGGTRGLGRAMAERLLTEGWRVAVCGRKAPDPAIEIGGNVPFVIEADVRDPASVGAMMEAVIAKFGRLDLLINNAGGGPAAKFADSSPRLIERIVSLNLLAPLYVAQAAYPHLKAVNGSIVNISSLSGRRPSPGTAAYGAAKAGLLSATTSLAIEWGPEVRVNAIIVGLVENPEQTEHYGGPDGVARICATIPLRRMLRGHDLAGMVAWLTTPDAQYINGACLELHGGGELPAFQLLVED